MVGDVFDRLADIADDSIDLVLTSPPFLALRSYLPTDHPDKCKEIGQEPTPAEFLQTLLEAELSDLRRQLADVTKERDAFDAERQRLAKYIRDRRAIVGAGFRRW